MTSPPAALVTEHRPRDAESTRAELLLAAKRRFTLHGYERTTVRDIATDAGANVSLINRYFGSKEGLFQAVVEQAAGTIAELPATTVAELVDYLLDGLTPQSWPEYGHQHPLLLLLHGIGADQRSSDLRRTVLRGVLTSFGALVADDRRDARAAALLALFAGVVVLHEALPDSAVTTTDSVALRAILGRTAAAIADG